MTLLEIVWIRIAYEATLVFGIMKKDMVLIRRGLGMLGLQANDRAQPGFVQDLYNINISLITPSLPRILFVHHVEA